MAFRRSQRVAAVILCAAAAAIAQPLPVAAPNAPLELPEYDDAFTAESPSLLHENAGPTPESSQADNPERGSVFRSPKEEDLVGSGNYSSGGSTGWVTTATALALVLALIFALKYVLRRMAPSAVPAPAGARIVEVLSRTPVGTRQQVLLIRVADRLLVIGAGAEGMSTLAEITDPEQVAELVSSAQRAKANSFTNSFASVMKNWGRMPPEGDLPQAMSFNQTSTPARGALNQVKSMIDRLRGPRDGGQGV